MSSKLLAVRVDEALLAEIDRERKRRRPASRSQAVREGLTLWVERRRLEEAIEQHRVAYARAPATADEFGAILAAQRWPKS
jgi:Arc/MetJ-type ribon-helix-helix transcriptional regulator